MIITTIDAQKYKKSDILYYFITNLMVKYLKIKNLNGEIWEMLENWMVKFVKKIEWQNPQNHKSWMIRSTKIKLKW